jgi:Core-2/I-Branching enzyme
MHMIHGRVLAQTRMRSVQARVVVPSLHARCCRDRISVSALAVPVQAHEQIVRARVCRVPGQYADPSLALAHRNLLRAALAQRSNAMFFLVSESCIPLHHPALFWAQLMSEAHVSRVADGDYQQKRWSPKMETRYLKMGHFRKSQQWSSLTRTHAQYVAYDAHVWTQFQAYCKTQARASLLPCFLIHAPRAEHCNC